MTKVLLILWVNGVGYILGESDSWDKCVKAMDALKAVNVETTCRIDK